MIRIYQKTVNDSALHAIKEFKKGCWVYVENPSERELSKLIKQLPLDLSLLKDALDPYEVPRVETENAVTYIFTRVPGRENEDGSTTPVLVAIGKDFIVTVSEKMLPPLEKFTKGEVDIFTTQKTRLFLQILSEINQAYNSTITRMNKNVRSTGIQLNKMENKTIMQFVNYERVLNDFLGALVPTNALLQKLLSGKFLTLYEKDKDLTEDLVLSNGQLVELCRTNLSSIGNIREAYSTIMTNDLNRVIKLLTSLTVIVTIPTMIASIYGMNIRLPISDSPLAFIQILGVIFSITFILLVIFIKKRWI